MASRRRSLFWTRTGSKPRHGWNSKICRAFARRSESSCTSRTGARRNTTTSLPVLPSVRRLRGWRLGCMPTAWSPFQSPRSVGRSTRHASSRCWRGVSTCPPLTCGCRPSTSARTLQLVKSSSLPFFFVWMRAKGHDLMRQVLMHITVFEFSPRSVALGFLLHGSRAAGLTRRGLARPMHWLGEPTESILGPGSPAELSDKDLMIQLLTKVTGAGELELQEHALLLAGMANEFLG
mmetsp:Transcript_81988/g.222614  ORF Transcript_81988/g.222614 Transcript_81988/m.222614 type:complete len:235 (-) Transcript_81988:135-839(-)